MKGVTTRTLERRLKRAEAIIEMLRIFYPVKVSKAEDIADLAMKTPDDPPSEAHP